MSEGSKWTPGKIILLVFGILAGLGILCCGGVFLIFGDAITGMYHFGTEAKAFKEQLQQDYGNTAVFDFQKNDRSELVLAIGVDGDLTPERVAQVEDGAWKRVGEIFGKDGFLPVSHVAVGRPVSHRKGDRVRDWSANVVSVEELVRRTGVPAPPPVKFMPEGMDHGHVRVHVNADGDDDEEDDGGGSGGK